MIYIATVCKNKDKFVSGRPEGDWASFIGSKKSDVIERAMEAKAKWERNSFLRYTILVGTLKEEVAVPTQYTLQPIKEKN